MHVHRDLTGEIAFGHSRGDFSDVADLVGEVARHGVDAVGQILPRSSDAAGFCLAAELAFGADFARHAGHFRGQRIQLVDHRIDSVFQFQYFSAHVHGDFTGEIALGHRGGDFGDISHLVGEVAGHGIHRIGQVAPGSGDAAHFCLTAEFPFGADFAGHAGHFRGERPELVHHGVDGVLQLQNFSARVHRDLGG